MLCLWQKVAVALEGTPMSSKSKARCENGSAGWASGLASAVWPLAHSSLAPLGQPQQELGALGSGRVPMFCPPELSPSSAFGEPFGSVFRLLVWCPGSIRQPGRMRVSKLCVIGLTAAILGCMFFVALSWFCSCRGNSAQTAPGSRVAVLQ